MFDGYEKIAVKPQHVILVGIALAAVYWSLDAALHSIFFNGVDLSESFFSPGPHDLCSRLLSLSLLTLFIGYVSHVLRVRDQLADALNAAMRKAEEERARTEAIIAAIGDGLSIQDTEFRVLYQNRRHQEFVGGNFAGEYCYKAYGCTDRVCPECPIALCYQDGQVHKVEKRTAPVIQVPHVEITASPLRDASGKIVAGIEIVRDVSQRKESEAKIRSLIEDITLRAGELAAANKELEAFSSAVSHDFRSHLTRIYSGGQLLKEMSSGVLDETGQALVQAICDTCENMDELIEALLSLSRVTSGEMSRTECDLSACAACIAAELQGAEPERCVEFAIEPAIRDCGDARLIKALLENLIANAWKYTRKVAEARIEFGATETDGERVYFVRDNGAGFDMEKADRLFKPFQRLHDNGEFKGTGIGLATVQRIVARHGGRVWGEGEVGRGATFYFTL